MNNVVNFPCSICSKNVEEDHHALQCSFCDSWSHNKCNNIKTKLYKFHQKNEDAVSAVLDVGSKFHFST